jgi:O-antigen/teichoic acid export membrane protein
MKNLSHSFGAGSFLRNMSVVMSGTVLAQVIGFLLMPVISRLYSSADYGTYGSFSAVLSIVGAVATLQYSQAIVLPKKNQDAYILLVIASIFVLVFSVSFGLVFLLFPSSGLYVFKVQSRWIVAAFILAVMANGLQLGFLSWCIRNKAFHRTSLSHIFRTIASSGIWTLMGFLGAGSWGLIVGAVVGSIVGLISLLSVVWRDAKQLGGAVSVEKMKGLAREYRDFPVYSAPQNLINAFSAGLPVLLLTYFYDAGVAGAYAFGQKCLSVPMNVIRNALRQVLFQRVSEVYNRSGNLWELYVKTTVGLAAVVLLPVMAVFAWLPQIFRYVFGAEWQVAGEYARWLILWMTINFCNVPAVLFSKVLRKQRIMLVYECVVLVTRVVSLVVCGLWFSAINSIMSFSILGMILSSSLIIWIGILVFRENQLNFITAPNKDAR